MIFSFPSFKGTHNSREHITWLRSALLSCLELDPGADDLGLRVFLHLDTDLDRHLEGVGEVAVARPPAPLSPHRFHKELPHTLLSGQNRAPGGVMKL